ncbi:MAG: hypothetical protein H5T95_13935 [Firmicutes bacterium]|nr:hypothetical protein [Bacillota bacterium]
MFLFHNHLTAEEIDYVADVLGARWGSAVGKGAGAVYEVATAAGQGVRTQLCRSIYRAVLPVDFFGWPTPLT